MTVVKLPTRRKSIKAVFVLPLALAFLVAAPVSAALMIGYADGRSINMRATLQSFPLQLKSVREYAGEVLMA